MLSGINLKLCKLFVDSHIQDKSKGLLYNRQKRYVKIIIIEVFNIQNLRMGDIGYRIHPEYWNKGITTEALKEVIRFTKSPAITVIAMP